MKFLGDYKKGTKLRVRLIAYEGSWRPEQESWLRKNVGKEIEGCTELIFFSPSDEEPSMTFRPKDAPLVLVDDEIEILGLIQ